MNKEKEESVEKMDVNCPDFYTDLQDKIEFDIARLKKDVKIIFDLRMVAAEVEVEMALLYHAEVWRDIEDLRSKN